jgi:hypothetical protein
MSKQTYVQQAIDYIAKQGRARSSEIAEEIGIETKSVSAILGPAVARGGWVLVPATLPPKIQAAIEALIRVMEASDCERIPVEGDVDYATGEQWDSAIDGGKAVLQLLEESGL